MASYANPQNLNRYSYVINNPLKFADPTGHMQESDSYKNTKKNVECKQGDTSCNWIGKYKALEYLRSYRNKGPSVCFACKPAQDYKLPADYTLHTMQEVSSQVSDEWHQYGDGLKVESKLFDIFMALQNGADSVKPVYRQAKGVFPATAVEMGVSASIQTLQDLDNDLNLVQRLGRSTIVGLEAGATDVVSDAYGAAGFAQAGPAGYVAASLAANFIADRSFDGLNSSAFPSWGLGTYP